MRRSIHTILFVLLLSGLSPRAQADTEEYNLVVGGQQSFPAEGIQNYSVSNPKMLQVAISSDGRSLVVKALKPGTATLLLIHENKAEPDRTITFNIFSRNPKQVIAELNEILRNFPDVQVRQNGPQIVLQGSVQTPQEEQKIKELEKNYSGQVISLVTVGPAGARRQVMVRLDLHYVQVRRRVGRQFGIGYPPNIGRPPAQASAGGGAGQQQGQRLSFGIDFFPRDEMGNLLPGTRIEAQYSIVTNLLPWLDLNEASGYFRILRTDTIVTENGARAVYRDGSMATLAIQPAIVGAPPTIKEIFIGSELTLIPRLSASNDAVSVEVVAELSQRDSAGEGGGVIFNRLMDRVETNVHLPIGQSVMLSGVKAKVQGRTTRGLPWLNRIPILGYLFGSEQYDSEIADGVVFITPTLIQATSPENRRRIDDALKRFEDP
ncbi:MAG: pilus assembly protein N-terminal domain-containing protein [Myxococcales bacterium]|nr:pilus assembly protein N-terminal domain-containing protein [Myxococcales bacterium]